MCADDEHLTPVTTWSREQCHLWDCCMLSFASRERSSCHCSCRRVLVWIRGCCTKSLCALWAPSVLLAAEASRWGSSSLVGAVRELSAHTRSFLWIGGIWRVAGVPARATADNFPWLCWFEKETERNLSVIESSLRTNLTHRILLVQVNLLFELHAQRKRMNRSDSLDCKFSLLQIQAVHKVDALKKSDRNFKTLA